MEKEYIDRLFDKELEFYLKTVGAVQIVGPKYCGKSRTAKRHAKTIIDLMKKKDRDQYVELAKNAPEALLNKGDKPILIDEWQVISFIWNSIKEAIDENGGFGQYILTGSVTDNTASNSLAGEENERHTGTGRIIKRVMRPMSLFESGDSNGKISITDLKNNVFKPAICDKDIFDYSYLICRGGWPLAIDKDIDIALQQAKTFYSGLVNEDLFSLKDIPLRKDEKRAKGEKDTKEPKEEKSKNRKGQTMLSDEILPNKAEKGFTWIKMNIGDKQRIPTRHIIRMMTSLGVGKRGIGKIDIRKSTCYVSIASRAADYVVEQTDNTEYRGHKLKTSKL